MVIYRGHVTRPEMNGNAREQLDKLSLGRILGQAVRSIELVGFFGRGGTVPLSSTVTISVLHAVVTGFNNLIAVPKPQQLQGSY